MIGAARDDAAAGTGEALAVRRAEMDSLEARFGALMKDLAANPAFPGQDRRMTALIAAYRADRKALIDLMFAVELDASERERAAAPGRRGRHSAAAAPRWVPRVVQGLAIPAGLGAALKGSLKHAVTAKPAVAALATPAGATALLAATVALAPSQTLPYVTGTTWHAPAAVIWGASPVAGPVPRLALASRNTDPQPVLHPARKPHAPVPLVVVTPLPAPVPAPVPAAAPVVTMSSPSEPRHTSSWSGSGSSSQPSTSYQPSQSSGSSQTYQARGQHAAPYSSEGNSSYQPGHGDNGQGGNYWQTDGQQGGNQQNDGWRGGQQDLSGHPGRESDRKPEGLGYEGAPGATKGLLVRPAR